MAGMIRRFSIDDIRSRKGADVPLVCLTAYSTPMAKILDPYVDILLVGDSLGMVLYGMEDTLDVDLEMMIRHGQAVMRGSETSFVVVDLPYGTYEENPEQAYESASRVLESTGAHAIKLEGGQERYNTIRYLSNHNIPVIGHIGLMPQRVRVEGGFKVKGKTSEDAARLIEDAKALEEAGAFCFVLEGTVYDVAEKVTQSVRIPSIGIGASPACDGQVLVTEDMLGMLPQSSPKFAKQYKQLREDIEEAAKDFADEVRRRHFPDTPYLYGVK